jgi:ribosomal-protein-alanine N-acetyltransferase
MAVRVRPASDADVDRVVEIAARSFAHPWSRESFASDAARSWTRVLVAEDTDEAGAHIVGFAHYWLVAGEVQVMNVATDPAFRRRGYGRALVAAMMQHAREIAAQLVLLEVRAGNGAAIALYSAFGFEETGRRERYYDDGEDAVLMAAKV